MDAQKLAKVLALAASDNETEALHALRTARRLLDGHGLDFVELANRLSADGDEALKDAVFDLRNEVRGLRAENERLRQGRPAAASAPPVGGQSFHDAARDAAELIRLRAELDGARAEVLRAQSHEAAVQEQFRQALAEAGALGLKVSELDGKRMRLEAENRRLSHANHALSVELSQARAQLQANRGTVPAAVVPLAATEPARGKKAASSAKGRGQYVLF